MMKQPQVLMFDLGGVLIENDTFSRLQALLSYAMSVAELKQKWLKSDAVRRFELGQCQPQEFAQAFLLEWSLPLTEQAFIAEFLSWPTGYYPGALAMLQTLRQSYRLVCLSNSNVLHWAKFGRLDQDFDLALSSHLLGAIKPDPAAFAMALAQCQATPDVVWYFDDSQANVLAAASMGIKAFHTDGFEAVRATLRANHLL
ncbi:HAD-IA family hydrolase [Undibacterium sp. Di27W]|uniref:HAD-IA family hydrolase n=1 Tax=Undibacterium sp. Di27W TaxID=3413036 RepID=UPI003BF3E86E